MYHWQLEWYQSWLNQGRFDQVVDGQLQYRSVLWSFWSVQTTRIAEAGSSKGLSFIYSLRVTLLLSKSEFQVVPRSFNGPLFNKFFFQVIVDFQKYLLVRPESFKLTSVFCSALLVLCLDIHTTSRVSSYTSVDELYQRWSGPSKQPFGEVSRLI